MKNMAINGWELKKRRQEIGLSQAKLAELTGISQHLLSAYELGKQGLADQHLKRVEKELLNTGKVKKIISRNKRVVEHKFSKIIPSQKRIKEAYKTEGNEEYLKLLNSLFIKHSSKEKEFKAISLFSGCGGFSLGFSAAGFSIEGFLELEDNLRKIYKDNFPNAFEMGSDITKIDDKKLQELKKKIGKIDGIIGGPPCQGFSLAGKRDIADPRNQLFRHYLRFVDIFEPEFAVLENVRVLTSMKNEDGGFVKDEIRAEFAKHGYRVEYFEVNANQYGVPQHRERVIFIAIKNSLKKEPSIPSSTHSKKGDLFEARPFRSFADACSDLSYIESGGKSEDPLHEAVNHPLHVIDWLWEVPQGKSAHDNLDPAKRPPSGYNTTYKRQVWSEPASTVQTTFGMISGSNNVHPIATRSLTVREAARIQSFPDQYKFDGLLGSVRTGIGNAVPPLLAYALAGHCKKLF